MTTQGHETATTVRAATGVEGLDDVLGGGFTPHRTYLIEGVPGSGKTTLALQFLLEGAKRGEPVLYVTLSETEDELVQGPHRTAGPSIRSRSASWSPVDAQD